MTPQKRVEVAAAIIRREDGAFLLGRRAPGGVYAGYWEFPGGKVEKSESPRDALIREIDEELGIRILEAHPWITRDYDYEHARVRLHFFEVTRFEGAPSTRIHAELAWQRAEAVHLSPLLPANAPVMKALQLPRVYGITWAWSVGIPAQLKALENALVKGLRLVQLREGPLDETDRLKFAHAVRLLTRAHGSLMLVNRDLALARTVGADGVHLASEQLLALENRPPFEWVGASCHGREELVQAARLGADFAVLGPVRETQSHPGVAGFGWNEFARIVEGSPIPVLAIGGVSPSDLGAAQAAGGHGIASIRGLWE